MSECKDINSNLSNLGKKIDGLNNKLNDLDNRVQQAERCCNNHNREGNRTNLNEILRRLAALEEAVRKIADYIKALEKAIDAASKPLQLISGFLNIFK